MAYILLRDQQHRSPEDSTVAWRRYRTYLDSIAELLPAAARSFALADWHYNLADHRAPHDAWVDSISVYESATGSRHEVRQLHIKLRLFGAYHDGHIEIEYKDVHRYSIGSDNSAHGDWLHDEIRLSESGHVLHEIEIGGQLWRIECRDIEYSWLPVG